MAAISLRCKNVLGHATLAMTQKYAHFSPGHMAEVVNLNPLVKFYNSKRALEQKNE